MRPFANTPHDFDLVIADLTMPLMTGDRLAEEMIAIRSDIPVIMRDLSEAVRKELDAERAA